MLEFLKELSSPVPYDYGIKVENVLSEDNYADNMLAFFENVFKLIDREKKGLTKNQYYSSEIHLSNLIKNVEFTSYLRRVYQIVDEDIATIDDIRKNGNQIKHAGETLDNASKEKIGLLKRKRFICVYNVASNYYAKQTRKRPPLWSEQKYQSLIEKNKGQLNGQRLDVLERDLKNALADLQKQQNSGANSQAQIEEIRRRIKERDARQEQKDKAIVLVIKQLLTKIDELTQNSNSGGSNQAHEEKQKNIAHEIQDTTAANKEKQIEEHKRKLAELDKERERELDSQRKARESKIAEMKSDYRAFIGKDHDELMSMSDSEISQLISQQIVYSSIKNQVCDDINKRAITYYNHYYYFYEGQERKNSMVPMAVVAKTEEKTPEKINPPKAIHYEPKKVDSKTIEESSYRAKRERICKVCGKPFTSTSKSKTCPDCKSERNSNK